MKLSQTSSGVGGVTVTVGVGVGVGVGETAALGALEHPASATDNTTAELNNVNLAIPTVLLPHIHKDTSNRGVLQITLTITPATVY